MEVIKSITLSGGYQKYHIKLFQLGEVVSGQVVVIKLMMRLKICWVACLLLIWFSFLRLPTGWILPLLLVTAFGGSVGGYGAVAVLAAAVVRF